MLRRIVKDALLAHLYYPCVNVVFKPKGKEGDDAVAKERFWSGRSNGLFHFVVMGPLVSKAAPVRIVL